MNWSDDRANELVILSRLLKEIKTLNSSSGTIERMQRCIAAAEILLFTDFNTGRDSFPQFLAKLCIADREKHDHLPVS